MDQQIEHVARALYDAEGDGLSWEHEPEILKAEFRRYARGAIALLDRQDGRQLQEPSMIMPVEFSKAA